MSETVIGTEMCPACGRVVWLTRLPSGLHYFHATGEACLGDQLVRKDDAEAVRLLRERGGERLRLAAHP
ncbi:hypothetical protein ACW7N6_38065 [Streptomyces sp. UC1A3]